MDCGHVVEKSVSVALILLLAVVVAAILVTVFWATTFDPPAVDPGL